MRRIVTLTDESWMYWTGRKWSASEAGAKLYTDRGASLAQSRIKSSPKHLNVLRDMGAAFGVSGYRVEVW